MFEGKEASRDAGAEMSLTERIAAVAAEIAALKEASADVKYGDKDTRVLLEGRLEKIVASIRAIEHDTPREEDANDEMAAMMIGAEQHGTVASLLQSARSWAIENEWSSACKALDMYLSYAQGQIPSGANTVLEERYQEAA